RLALGDEAKFERRSDRNVAARADGGFQIIDRLLIEMRLRSDRGDRFATRPRPDRRSAQSRVEPGALADHTAVQAPGRRREDHAERGHALFNEGYVDRVIVAAPDELLGAVERIDQKECFAVRRDPAGGDLFLGDNWNPRRGA